MSATAPAIEFHPIANVFPLIEGTEFDELVADIRKHGLREAIILHPDGRILDGRNRYRACIAAAVDPRFEAYDGDDALAFVVSLNLRRRHLNESQRAMVAANIANLGHGGNRRADQAANLPLEKSEPLPVPTATAASMMKVSERSVRSARVVQQRATPALVEKVAQGIVAVSVAADVALLSEAEQAKIVDRGERAILKAAKEIRIAKAKMLRAGNDAIKARIVTTKPDGRYDVIVADPPWDMQKIERDVRPNQVGFDYPTMTEAELLAFPLPDMAADNCHLFCWTPQRFLPVALRLVEAWGFRYVLTMVWHKPGGFQPVGLPQFNCEFVILARRGTPAFTDTTAFPCCFSAPRREHSRKPDTFYDLIRRVTDGRRIDLFSREPRPGFAQHGNETAKFAAA